MFRSTALSATDDIGAGYESFAQPVISKATLLLNVTTSVTVNSAHVTELVSDDDEPGVADTHGLDQMTDDDEWAGNEKPEWTKVFIIFGAFFLESVSCVYIKLLVYQCFLNTI